MENLCGDCAYSIPHMKKLLHHFGDCISIISKNGKADKIMMTKTASVILNEFSEQQYGLTVEEKKKKIIRTAAKLIRSDICSMKVTRKYYPTPSHVSSIEKKMLYQIVYLIFSQL
jgi:hypothetical protein